MRLERNLVALIAACALLAFAANTALAGGHKDPEYLCFNSIPRCEGPPVIVAPKGFYKSYRHALQLVNAKCDRDNQRLDPARQYSAYMSHKRSLDRRLARKGLDLSPEFDRWTLEGFQLRTGQVIYSRCQAVG